MIDRLEHDDVFAVTTLAVADPDLLAELRVPPVADDGNFTDMGRMNGDSPAVEKPGCLSAAMTTDRLPATCSR